jgi:pantoate--beta-alanine ligase
LPGIGERLEGAFRPGFFRGVATVVTKLFLLALPDKAYFGEKDYQQLCVIRRLVADLDIPVAIEGCPVVREPDGLALSSRNAYLDERERAIAPALHGTLVRLGERLGEGEEMASAIAWGTETLLRAGFSKVDYLALCDTEDMDPLEALDGPARLLAAAWLERTRLIDNIGVG